VRRLLFAAALIVWWSPGWAASFALVIGINDYQHLDALQGAVADAEDVAEALRGAGAIDVQVLTDGDANRMAIAAAWQDLVRQTKTGASLIFSFAGRGGPDDVLLLAGFTEAGPGNGERITRDQLFAWFAEAAGRQVFFLGDTSHGGALIRAVDSRAPAMARRFTAHGAIIDDTLPATDARTIKDLPHVTLVLASGYSEAIPEMMIDSAPRGALSWTVARALEGRADVNNDGAMTLGEIADYVVENVRILSERRHHPRIVTGMLPSTVVMTLVAPLAATPDKARWVGVYVLGVEDEDAQTLRYTIGPSIVLSASVAHELIWDRDKLQMITTAGDVAATLANDDIRQLRRVIDKWNLVAAVRALGERHGLRTRLEPGDGLYQAGEPMSLKVHMAERPFLTLFSIAADGTTDFMFPYVSASLSGDEDLLKVPGNTNYEAVLRAGPPFGADHVIAITSTTTLVGLHGTLRLIHGKPAPKLLKKGLLMALDGIDYRIGIHARYTAP